MVRKHYVFHGRVQGVGFRITVYQVASRLGLTGTVDRDDGVHSQAIKIKFCK